jgi:hypothetical protein
MTPRALARAKRAVLTGQTDPLFIRASTLVVVRRAQKVSLRPDRISSRARLLAQQAFTIPAWNFEYHYFDGTARTLTYLLLLDALNFSFWGEPKWTIKRVNAALDGYWALAAALKFEAERNPAFLEADSLAELTPQSLARVLRGTTEIPLFVERWRNAQELGRVLRDRFGGSASRLVESAHGDAARLARLVATNFSSFNDSTVYNGRQVNFFKRAQIVAGDIYGSFGGEKWGRLRNLDTLTAFADYKLPQLLRAWGILEYSPELARRVDRRIPLAKDSREEIEIRAGMIWAVELLRFEMAGHGVKLNSVQMDWFLWQSSQGAVPGMKPYHRVRTIYY